MLVSTQNRHSGAYYTSHTCAETGDLNPGPLGVQRRMVRPTQDAKLPDADELCTRTGGRDREPSFRCGATGDRAAPVPRPSFQNGSTTDEERGENIRGWLVQMGGEEGTCPEDKSLPCFLGEVGSHWRNLNGGMSSCASHL